MKHTLCWRYDRVNRLEPNDCLLSKDDGSTFLNIRHADGTVLPATFDSPVMASLYLESITDTVDIPDIDLYKPVRPTSLIFNGVEPNYHKMRLLVATCPQCGRLITELTHMRFQCDVCDAIVELPAPTAQRKGAD